MLKKKHILSVLMILGCIKVLVVFLTNLNDFNWRTIASFIALVGFGLMTFIFVRKLNSMP